MVKQCTSCLLIIYRCIYFIDYIYFYYSIYFILDDSFPFIDALFRFGFKIVRNFWTSFSNIFIQQKKKILVIFIFTPSCRFNWCYKSDERKIYIYLKVSHMKICEKYHSDNIRCKNLRANKQSHD